MSEASDHNMLSLRPLQHWSHDHPLMLVEEQKHGNEEVVVDCSMCEEPIHEHDGSTSNYYCCTEFECKFNLHKTCVELPRTIHLPIFHKHILKLHRRLTFQLRYCYCNICYDSCEFFYACYRCVFFVDIKCAFLPNLSRVKHIWHDHPLISATKRKGLLNIHPCVACDETMPGPVYSCPDCRGFYLHKKCVQLPPKITHPSHRKHPLLLLTKEPPLPHPERCSCHLCKNQIKGFVYHCSHCDFDLKIKHVFSSQLVTGTHEHPFNLVSKPMPFICDACGTGGDNIPYICITCNLAVHKDCIWLPKLIKIMRHVHLISHLYSLVDNDVSESTRWECQICSGEVNTEYGSYYCSDCKYIVHVDCAVDAKLLEDDKRYEYLRSVVDASMTSAEDVTATEIKHFSHQHNLKLVEEMKTSSIDTLLYCDGCMQLIIPRHSFYFCEQCDFFLHKSCAKLPMKTRHWHVLQVLLLKPYCIFKCFYCRLYRSGFRYSNRAGSTKGICLSCFGISDRVEHPGHEHRLFFDRKHRGHCNACGDGIFRAMHKCKECNFGLCFQCISLPQTARHKYDEHLLTLTTYGDHDSSDDPSQCCCDICEQERDPSRWFYRCSDCNFSAHPKCTLGKYPFIKRGIKFWHKDHHPHHRLISVQKVYFYPECKECDKPCLDLAAECEDPECNYICHWECLHFPGFFPIRD